MTVTTSARTVQRWALPSELAGMVPRDVRLSSAGRVVAALAAALMAAAVAAAIALSIAVAGGREHRERVLVDAQTISVDRTGGEHPRRIVSYRFAVDDRSYQGRTRLREGDHREVFQGTLIPVEYVASDPAENWIRGYEPRGVPPWTIPLVSGSLLAAAAGVARGLRRSCVLLSEGRAVEARVLSQKKVQRDKHSAYEITCEFRDLSGALHSMRYDVLKAPPAVGTALTIVYHRDDPRWHAVYPLRNVRPARAPQRARRTSRRRSSFLEGHG
jgi:hypothetical protein